MTKNHHYATTVTWVGNRGKGTVRYDGYTRDYEISTGNKPPIPSSSDAAFHGDPSRWSPEDQLVAALSGCHMLWYLHLCAVNGVIVVEYSDNAEGVMLENDDRSGQFTKVVLRPQITVRDAGMMEAAYALHSRAHEMCYIARSVNFPVVHEPRIKIHQPS